MVEVGGSGSGVSLIDLGGLAHTAGERALAELIEATHAMPVSDRIATHSVDSQLLALLTRMDLDAAEAGDLVEAAAAAERVEAAAHAIKLRAAAHLSRREAMRPAALAQREAAQRDVAGDELAVRLRTTVRAGADLVRRGKALEETLSATGDALGQGVIDAGRARVIVDGLEHVDAEVAATVESRVLARAPDRTVAQLRSDVAKALIAVDADQAAQRARQRASQRRVSRPRAHPDGIASMRLEGPAADVLALDVALQAAARAAKTAGDTRSIDQLRFDTLAGIAHHALTTGHLGSPADGLPLATQNGHRPTILITISLDQLLPPKTGDGATGAGASTKGASSADGMNGASGHGAGNGRDGAGAGNGNGAGRATGGCACRGAAGTGTGNRGSGGDDGLWPPPLPGERLRPDQVPTLDGYGPINPTLARALAAGGDWIRLVTDPLTGGVLDVGHTRYRPTQAMIDHLLARDRTCVRPGCTHRASECQIDHTHEWNHTNPDRGGLTAVTNLGPLCGRDHQVKTHGDFRLTQPEPGIFEWTTPTGHRYRREPDGTTTSLNHPTHQPRYGTTPDDAGTDEASGEHDPPDYGPPPF